MTRISFPFYTRSNECVYTNDIVKCSCNVCISPVQNVYAWVKDSEFRHNILRKLSRTHAEAWPSRAAACHMINCCSWDYCAYFKVEHSWAQFQRFPNHACKAERFCVKLALRKPRSPILTRAMIFVTAFLRNDKWIENWKSNGTPGPHRNMRNDYFWKWAFWKENACIPFSYDTCLKRSISATEFKAVV